MRISPLAGDRVRNIVKSYPSHVNENVAAQFTGKAPANLQICKRWSRPTRRMFFHIGLHKTATTLLQEVFFPNLSGLEFIRTKDHSLIHRKAFEDSSQPLLVSDESLSCSTHRKAAGHRSKQFTENLTSIASTALSGGIIIGFREHVSWLNSAFSEKAKKRATIDPDKFVRTFAIDELQWCKIFAEIESTRAPVFGFLYEELLFCPDILVRDLCSFLGTTPLSNWTVSLERRVNPSPRSALGQRVSRSFYSLSNSLKGMHCVTKTLRSQLKRSGMKLGTLFDYCAPAAPPVKVTADLAKVFHTDWNDLIHVLGQRRGRDLTAVMYKASRKGRDS